MRIQVEVKDEKLVVTMDDTSYRAIFYKSPDEPRLIQAASLAVDREAPMSHEDFEALAWTAAKAKARDGLDSLGRSSAHGGIALHHCRLESFTRFWNQ